MRNGILIKYGEIAIKGNNRRNFEGLLIANIRERLADIGQYRVSKEQGRLLVEPLEGSSADEAVPALQKVFGIVGISRASIFTDDSLDSLYAHALELLKETYGENPAARTFKVEVRRANKNSPYNSIELAAMLGEKVLDAFPAWTVDVHKPDIKLMLELRNRCYVYSETLPGAGGMPVSGKDKAALLLSGGIDSPVAGYMIAKRGVELVSVYFHAHPYTSERTKEKVIELARRVSVYSGHMKLYVVPFTDIELDIYDHCPEDEITIIMRRLMMRIAEKIAKKEGAEALITGEDLGQVASQTLQSLVCTNAVCTLPVFRPLIGFDKQEIIRMAEAIDTFETSILPYEDCCTVFVAKHPVTKPRLEKIEKSEQKLTNIEEAMEKAIEESEIVELVLGKRVEKTTEE